MSDIIRLLPERVANQIAAGEVIQRPSSVVKELLENSIDAGATQVKLVVKDAGKTLIQVIDNGSGMSFADAKMAFVKHATSKIQEAEDIFRLRSKGFRGEALASVAAIAQVELFTRQKGNAVGTRVYIDDEAILKHEPCACAEGSQFLVKNIFYNTPARRNFLKANAVEYRNILQEFERVALTHPEVEFYFYNQDELHLHLPASNLRQRLVNWLGKSYNEKLATLEEESTDFLHVRGFIGKPQFAKKKRGEQYLFVNERYIKSPYLHNAVMEAFKGTIPSDAFPSYFIYLDIDPERIDINVHPTKTEIQFQDEQIVYTFILSTVRKCLGKFNLAPSIDFNLPESEDVPFFKHDFEPNEPSLELDEDYNPFLGEETAKNSTQYLEKSHFIVPVKRMPSFDYEHLDESLLDEDEPLENLQTQANLDDTWQQTAQIGRSAMQLSNGYILFEKSDGLCVLDPARAYHRIVYERVINSLANRHVESQRLLFPTPVELGMQSFAHYQFLETELHSMGFEVSSLGKHTLALQAIPSYLQAEEAAGIFCEVLENIQVQKDVSSLKKYETLALHLAQSVAQRHRKKMQAQEINQLLDDLFACENAQYTPHHKTIFVLLTLEQLKKNF
jgi:DNA mismatch repair protein MutL